VVVHPRRRCRRCCVAASAGDRGIYNVIDDDPAPVSEWLPGLAKAIGAPNPMRVPKFLGRILAGEAGAVMMTEVRGASNAKAKTQLGWSPQHASWRRGFAG
jgi:nucleoside-diphosphate-sugar epimerase